MFQMKKVLAGAVAAVMAMGMTVCADKVETGNTEALAAMRALEIMVGDADSTDFRGNDPIKRSEFAKVAIYALGLENIAQANSAASKFPDVQGDHWAVGYINTAAQQGIVIGDDLGNFRPDDSISYAEAMTVLVRMTGYEPSANAAGGYPTGYLTVGVSNGISDKVSQSWNTPVIRNAVAQMTYNALRTKMMEQTGYGENANYQVTDKTLLENKLNVTMTEGILEATPYSGLAGSGAGRDRVTIGGETYVLNCATAPIGCNVKALVRDTDLGETVFCIIANNAKNSVLTVAAEDIDALTANSMQYWDGNANVTKNITGATVLYNGRADEAATIPTMGSVTLIDNNRDNVYDVVAIAEYTNVQVEEVFAASHKIIDTEGNSLTLDPDDASYNYTICDAAGNALELDKIAAKNILSVEKSRDGSLIHVVVSDKTAEGTVEEVTGKKVVLGGAEYESVMASALKPGDEVKLYLDASGKIAAADAKAQNGANYAYLAAAEKTAGIDAHLECKLLTMDGKTVVLQGADRMRIDGVGGKTADMALAELGRAAQLITYQVNAAGEISEITRAADKSDASLSAYDGIFAMNTVLDNAVYKNATMKLGNINIAENTILFDIPDGEADMEKYAVRDYHMLTDNTTYSGYVYDMAEDLTARVVVITNAASSAAADSPITVVRRITSTTNADGGRVDKLYGCREGKETEVLAAEGTSLQDLQVGDIVQYTTNFAGEIDSVTQLFDSSDRETEFVRDLSADMTVLYGKVTRRFANGVNVSANGGAEENFKTTDATVYKYTGTGASETVTVTDASAIRKYDEGDAERVFMTLYKGQVREIVIVRA